MWERLPGELTWSDTCFESSPCVLYSKWVCRDGCGVSQKLENKILVSVWCGVIFLLWWQILCQKQFEEGNSLAYSLGVNSRVSQWWVGGRRNTLVAGHLIFSQKAECAKCWYSSPCSLCILSEIPAHGMALPTSKVGPLFPLKLLWNTLRYPSRRVSQANRNLAAWQWRWSTMDEELVFWLVQMVTAFMTISDTGRGPSCWGHAGFETGERTLRSWFGAQRRS